MRLVEVTINTVLASETFIASLLSRSIEITKDAADYRQPTNMLSSACATIASVITISGAMTNIPGRVTTAQFKNARGVTLYYLL